MYFSGVVFISILAGLCHFVGGQQDEGFDHGAIISVIPSTNKLYVHKNSQLVIDCIVSYKSAQVSFLWYKDEVKVTSQKRVYVATNGSLVIEKVLNKRRKGRNDSGLYECFVDNGYGQILGRRVEIIITKQSISISPERATAHVGGVARFECRFNDSSLYTPYYHWGVPSPTGSNIYKEVTDDMAVLQVFNVSKQDEGSYSCKVLHLQYDGMLEKSAFLEVTEDSSGVMPREPELLSTQQHITVEAGHPALLECLVQGGSKTIITWQRDGMTLVPSEKLSLSGHSNLKVFDAQLEDSGMYMCIISHPGHQDIQRTYMLNVLIAPSFEMPAFKTLSNILAQRARLSCNISGNPTPTITWYKDGLRIHPTPEPELIIHGRSDEIGYYQCLVENSVGYAIFTTWMHFRGKAGTPGEVGNLTGMALSSTVVQLRWDPPLDPLYRLVGYGVDYRQVSDIQCPGKCMHHFEMMRDLSSHTLYNITNLKPYTQYAFSVQGYNFNGAGAMSEEIMVRTLEAVPNIAPDVQIIPDTTTSFRVKWTELPAAEANGVINKHKLFFGTDLKMEVTELIGGDDRDFIVVGLELDTLYKVRVLAGNSAGYPDITDNWVTFRTPAIGVSYCKSQ